MSRQQDSRRNRQVERTQGSSSSNTNDTDERPSLKQQEAAILKACNPEIIASAKAWNLKLNHIEKHQILMEHYESGTTPPWLASHLTAFKKLSPLYQDNELLMNLERTLLQRHITHAKAKVDNGTETWQKSLQTLEQRVKSICSASPDTSILNPRLIFLEAQDAITSKSATMQAKQLRDAEKRNNRKEQAERAKAEMETEQILTRQAIRNEINQVIRSKNGQRPSRRRPPSTGNQKRSRTQSSSRQGRDSGN